jgi:uroporphyrinogen-III decarboxylase
VRAAAERCLGEAMAGGGYVLSTACSVAPASPPENILQIRAAAEAAGRYARTR